MVIVSSSVYGGYAASNFQNVEFFYSNGSVVPSWLQNYTSTNATWWLKLSSISASSSKTVYMGFVSKSTNLFNTANDGEAPQLTCPNPSETNITSSNCPSYGVYDDGARVFLYYNNFSTSSDASYYNSPPDAPPNETLSIDDSLHVFLKDISNFDGFMSTPAIDSYYNLTTYITSSGIAQNTTNGVSYDWQTVGCGSGQYNQVNLPFGRPSEAYFKNYFIGIVKSVFSNCGNSYIMLQAVPGTYGYVNIAYLFASTYLPNDKMPSVSFGYPSNITKPANIQSYAPLTISNNQNVSVLNFQQMVNVPSSVFTGYANTASGTAFQNVEFFYANGTVIPSWLENYTSSNALYWIKLPSVPAETSFTVYLGFAPTSTNLFNTVNDGEAPQLSSTYAEYDDGVNVFNNYWDFAGTSLPSGWTQVGTGYSINNGFEFQSAGTGSDNNYIESTSTFSQGIITEAYIYPTNSGWMGFSQFGTYSSGGALFYYFPSQNGWEVYNGNELSYTGDDAENTYYIMSAITPGLGYAYLAVNYQTLISSSSSYIANPNGNLYVGDSGGTGTMYWLRTRAYPPNGVMPSVSFGSVS